MILVCIRIQAGWRRHFSTIEEDDGTIVLNDRQIIDFAALEGVSLRPLDLAKMPGASFIVHVHPKRKVRQCN